MLTQEQRINLTTSCRDSDYIPKVSNAGSVITAEGGDRVQVMHNGCIVLADAYYSSFQTEIIQDLRGHHEPQEEKELLFNLSLESNVMIPLIPKLQQLMKSCNFIT